MRSAGAENWVSTAPGAGWRLSESGTYTYGKRPNAHVPWTPTGIVERYCEFVSGDRIHRRIRAHRDARSTTTGLALRVEAWCRPAGFSRIEFELRTEDRIAVSRVRYEISHQRLQVHRHELDVDAVSESISLSEGSVFLPLTRNFLGPVIASVLAAPNGKTQVVVPDLRDPGSTSVFAPLVSERTAVVDKARVQSIKRDHRLWSTTMHHFVGGPYNETSEFWLCRRSNRLIHYHYTGANGEEWSSDLVDFVQKKI